MKPRDHFGDEATFDENIMRLFLGNLGCNTNCDENKIKDQLHYKFHFSPALGAGVTCTTQMTLYSKSIFSWQYQYILKEIGLKN